MTPHHLRHIQASAWTQTMKVEMGFIVDFAAVIIHHLFIWVYDRPYQLRNLVI